MTRKRADQGHTGNHHVHSWLAHDQNIWKVTTLMMKGKSNQTTTKMDVQLTLNSLYLENNTTTQQLLLILLKPTR
jgi:hypothetical protein